MVACSCRPASPALRLTPSLPPCPATPFPAGQCLLEWEGEGEPPLPLLKDMFASERRKAKVGRGLGALGSGGKTYWLPMDRAARPLAGF